MDNITIFSRPVLQGPTLIAAFAGWPDAGTIATMAVLYLRDSLRAILFAEVRPDEFYVFTRSRPHTSLGDNPWERRITWPANELYFVGGSDRGPDLVLLPGIEPNLKWPAFVASILDLAEELSVKQVIGLGSTLDSVPHTRDPQISGTSSSADLREALERLSVRPSAYEGPTSIHSALMEACDRRGLPNASLWGHSPLYLQDTPNPRVCHALLRKLEVLLGLHLDLDAIREAAEGFDLQLDRAVAKNSDLREYVRRLEEAMESRQSTEEMPSAESVVRDLEEYLRHRGHKRNNGEDKKD
ncbi:MAG: PAC2 family protein [Dehalococcoidia bacterium]|nr:PAC2 family protein [Dehalococcoidia bacterium]